MNRKWLVCAIVLVSLEVGATSSTRQSTPSEDELLAGASLPFDVSSLPMPIGDDEAFGLDDEMRAFVEPIVGVAAPAERLNRLREAMEGAGLFALGYSNAYTRTVRATFHEREANCLSFTMLFVALAREAGLETHYNVVDVPPTFDSKLGNVVVGRHVNAIVDESAQRKFIVDFNEPNYREKYPYRTVSDRYAAALFYNNLGAEALVRQQYEQSFALFRQAARTHAEVPGIWVNLGVLYARHRLYDYAAAANLRALAVDPMEMSALANLVSLYSQLGERRLAAAYRQRLRNYRKINPYYHFVRAQIAYDEKRYRDALGAVRSAIRLKGDGQEFYLLQGRAFTELGRARSAAGSFERAKSIAAGQ